MVEPLGEPERPLPGSARRPLEHGKLPRKKLKPDERWIRVYHFNPKYDPHGYRDVGPFNRLDPHPPGAGGKARRAADGRGVTYLAKTLACALVESHPDQKPDVAICPHKRAFVASSTKQVKLLDLRGNGALQIGAVGTLLSGDEPRPLTQRWGRAIYEDLPEVAGVLYRGAHQGDRCIALWERAGSLEVHDDRSLAGSLRDRTVGALRAVARRPVFVDAVDCPECRDNGLA